MSKINVLAAILQPSLYVLHNCIYKYSVNTHAVPYTILDTIHFSSSSSTSRHKKASLSRLKSRITSGIAVYSAEFWLLLGAIFVSSLISAYAQFKITQIAASNVAGRISELDSALGTAIQSILERADTVQAENPLMAIFAKALDSKMQAPIGEAKVIEKNELGQFVKKNE